MIDTFNIDSVDQYDENGKRHGWCVQYLKQNWNNCKKKKKARYCYYKFFYHGRTSVYTNYGKRKGLVLDMKNMDTTTQPIVLNGRFASFNKEGNLISEWYFKNGLHEGISKYFFKNGKPISITNYEKKFENQFPSYYLKIYHKAGFVKYEGYIKFSTESGYMFTPK